MKALIVPDVHMKLDEMLPHIERHWNEHQPDILVFLGDYFDEWGKTGDDDAYLRTVDQLRCIDEHYPTIFLLGNHDIPYLMDEPQHYSSDSFEIHQAIKDCLLSLNPYITYEVDDILLVHGGWIETPTDRQRLQWLDIPQVEKHWLMHNTDGPLWVRPDILAHCSHVRQPQIVGHTPTKQVQVFKTPESQFITTDTWSTYRDGRPIGDCDIYLLTNGQFQSINHGYIPWNQKEEVNVIER